MSSISMEAVLVTRVQISFTEEFCPIIITRTSGKIENHISHYVELLYCLIVFKTKQPSLECVKRGQVYRRTDAGVPFWICLLCSVKPCPFLTVRYVSVIHVIYEVYYIHFVLWVCKLLYRTVDLFCSSGVYQHVPYLKFVERCWWIPWCRFSSPVQTPVSQWCPVHHFRSKLVYSGQ